MTEHGPKAITRLDVFKGLRRKLAPSLNMPANMPRDLVDRVDEGVKAFNALYEFIEDGNDFPKSWDGLEFDAHTRFSFLKEKDGQYYKRDGQYLTPTDFINAMKEFHGLTELVSDEERQETERAKAAEAYLSTTAGIRELRLRREAANAAKAPDIPPTTPTTPKRTSVFRPRG
jgi:hypothetical protein